MYQGSWEVISFGYIENGSPFSVLSVVVQGRLTILSMYDLYAASLCSVG